MDLGTYSFDDVVEYFIAILKVFLKLFGIELDGEVQVGDTKIEIDVQ